MSDEQYRYEHDQIMGDYVLKHGNRVLFRATSLAVCYSEDTEILGIPGEPAYTLLKHGNSDQVPRPRTQNSNCIPRGWLPKHGI